MEGSTTLSLLEKVLTGRPGNPQKHLENYKSLQKQLLQTNAEGIKSARMVLSNLSESGQMSQECFEKFSLYLNQITNGKKVFPPNLDYLTFTANPTSQKTAILMHALHKISMKNASCMIFALEKLKKNTEINRNMEGISFFELETKRQKCMNLISNLKVNHSLNLQKTLLIWDKKIKEKGKKLKNILEKSNLRWFYAKYLSFERWDNETWDQQEVVDEYWEDNEYYEKKPHKRLKKKIGEDSTLSDFKDILMSMTDKARHFQHFDSSNRISALNNSILHFNSSRGKLDAVVKRILLVSKLRKEMPRNIISKWNNDTMISYITRNILRSVLKETQKAKKITFFTWKTMIQIQKNIRKTKTSKSLVKQLNNAFKRNAKICLNFQKYKINKKRILVKSIINACKNLRIVLFLSFAKWAKSNHSMIGDRKRIMTLENLLNQKNEVFKRIAGQNLINSLKASAVNNQLRNVFNKICDKSPMLYIKKVLGIAFDNFNSSLSKVLGNWKKNSDNIKQNEIFLKLKSEKLDKNCSKIAKKQIRGGFDRIIRNNSKIQNALGKFNFYLLKAPRLALEQWKKYLNALSQKKVLDMVRGQKLKSLVQKLGQRVNNTIFSIFRVPQTSVPNDLSTSLSGQRLNILLYKIPLRTLKVTFEILLGKNFKLKLAINKVKNLAKKITHRAITQWMNLANEKVKRALQKSGTKDKLKGCLQNIVKRRTRETLTRMLLGLSKIKDSMRGLVDGLSNIPKFAIKKWNKIVIDIKCKELINNNRGMKVISILQRIPKRTITGMLRKIAKISLIATKLRLSLQTIQHIRRRRPKELFDRWKKHAKEMQNQSIIKDYNIQLVKVCLTKLVKRTLKESLEKLTSKEINLKNSLKFLISLFEKKMKNSFNVWKNAAKAASDLAMIISLKHRMLRSELANLCKRTLRDSVYRILGGGDKVVGTIKGLVNGLQNIPKKAISRWYKTVQVIKTVELQVSLRANKIDTLLKKCLLRVQKEVTERIKGIIFLPPSLQGYLLNLYNLRKRRPKEAFDRWKNFMFGLRNNFLLEQLRIIKLQFTLVKMSTRVLRDCVQRIMGGGNKIKGAMLIYLSAIHRRPKSAFDRWKNYIYLVNHKKLLDSFKNLKLKNCLERIALRTSRLSVQKIIGGGDRVKGAITGLVSGMKAIPLKAITRWSRVVLEIKEKRLMDNVRCQKLKIKMGDILRKTLREIFKRIIINDKSITFVKSKIKRLEALAKTKRRQGFNKWKDYINQFANQSLRSFMKGHKLYSILSKIVRISLVPATQRIVNSKKKIEKALSRCLSALKNKPKDAFSKLKSYSESLAKQQLMGELAISKLKFFLDKVARKGTGEAFKRICKRNEKVTCIVQNIVNVLKSKPKTAILNWHRKINTIKDRKISKSFTGFTHIHNFLKNHIRRRKKEVLDLMKDLKNERLKTFLYLRAIQKMCTVRPKIFFEVWKKTAQNLLIQEQIRRLRAKQFGAIFENIIVQKHQKLQKTAQNFNSFVGNFKNHLRNLNLIDKRLKNSAFDCWKNAFFNEKTRQLLANLNSQKLRLALEKVSRRKLRDSTHRILGEGDKVKGALKTVYYTVQKKPRHAFEKWKNFVANSQKKVILNNLREQKCKALLTKVTARTFRQTLYRIFYSDDKVKGALNTVVLSLTVRPKQIIQKWKLCVQYMREQLLFNNARSFKLKSYCEKISVRTIREAFDKIMDVLANSIVLTQNLKSVKYILSKKSKAPFGKWKDYLQYLRRKKILDNLNCEKLKQFLDKLTKARLKNYLKTILSEVKKMKFLKKMIGFKHKISLRDSFSQWQKQTNYMSRRIIFNDLISQKLKDALSKISMRAMRSSIRKILGEDEKVKEALNIVVLSLKAKPKLMLKKWKLTVQFMRELVLNKYANYQKMKSFLKSICVRTLRNAYDRIIDTKKVRLMQVNIKWINRILQRKPKEAFDIWVNFAKAYQRKNLENKFNSQKLLNIFDTLARYRFKGAFHRVIGEGSKVKGALKTIYLRIQAMPRHALGTWKKFINEKDKKIIFDELKSQKLKESLFKTLIRTLRTVFDVALRKGSITNFEEDQLKKMKGFRIIAKRFEDRKKFGFDIIKEKIRGKRFANKIRKFFTIYYGAKSSENNRKSVGFNTWKDRVNTEKAEKKINDLKGKIVKNSLKTTIKRIKDSTVHKILQKSQRLKKALRNFSKIHNKKFYFAFNNWRSKLFIKRPEVFAINKGINILKKLCRGKSKELFDSIYSKIKTKRILSKLVKNLSEKKRSAFETIKEKGKQNNLVKKIGASYVIASALKNLEKFGRSKGFTSWKENLNEKKNIEKINGLKGLIVKNKLSQLMQKGKKFALGKISQGIEKFKEKITILGNILMKKKRTALQNWNSKLYVKKPEIIKLSQGINVLNRLCSKKLRGILTKIGDGVKKQKIVNKILKNYTEKQRSALITMKERVKNLKNLKKLTSLISAFKGIEKFKVSHAFNSWKQEFISSNHSKTSQILKGKIIQTNFLKVITRIKKNSINKIVQKSTLLQKIFKNLEKISKNKQKTILNQWHSKLFVKRPNISALHKGLNILKSLCKKSSKKFFNSIFSTMSKIRILTKLLKNQFENKRLAYNNLKERIHKIKLVKKISSSYSLLKLLKSKAEQMISGRFNYWKNLEALRIYRIKKHVIMKMIYHSSINYENSFWKLKFVWSHKFYYFDPKHSVMYKRLTKIVSSYQTRLKQYAHFKLVMYYKTTPMDKLIALNTQILQRRSSESRAMAFLNKVDIQSTGNRAMTPIGFRDRCPTPIRPSTPISSAIPIRSNRPKRQTTPLNLLYYTTEMNYQNNLRERLEEVNNNNVEKSVEILAYSSKEKLSDDEVKKISQIGASHVIALQIKNAWNRTKAVALMGIVMYYQRSVVHDAERVNFIEEIHDLRCDKESLLGDNASLRKHNEILIENLEQSNFSFQAINLHLNDLKVSKMVKILAKMVEIPVIEGFVMIRNHRFYEP